MNAILKSLDSLVSRIEGVVIVTFTLFALFSGVMQVVLRYVFNTGYHWNEPLFVTLTVWAVFFGSSRAVRDHVHVRVEVIADNLPRPLAQIAGFLSYFLSLSLTLFYFYCGMKYVQFVNSMDIASMETGIPEALTYSIVPIAMGLMAIRYIILMIDAWRDPESMHAVGDSSEMRGT